MKTILNVCLVVVLFATVLIAQVPWTNHSGNLPESAGPFIDFNHISKKPGHYTAEDWRTVIDTTWGEGLSTETKLQIFDYVYDEINSKFACFQGLNVDMDSLWGLYRTEIESGVSRGRFAAIMNYFVLSFKEGHNWIIDEQVNFNDNTPPAPGTPLFVVGAWSDNSHFGATLTPLPDSSLLVIKTLPNHPLGLVPGDIVLGYDGIPWKILYKEILKAQLPFFQVFFYPSNEKSFTHVMLKDAGMNWHLFDTLDVVKYSSGDTSHYPTALLASQSGNLGGNEQLEIPGVPFPDINWQGVFNFDVYKQINYVSWGIVDGTKIGYVYVYSWATPYQAPGSDIANEFYQAIDSLMNHYKVEGLIFDSRLDFGWGQFDTEDKGFSLLFNSYIETIALDIRCNPDNHFEMCPHAEFTPARIAISGDPRTLFDRPIAVLTGPGAFSMGDIIPLKMRFHPMTRIFGKPTAGAFSGTNILPNPAFGWTMLIAFGNNYLVSEPGNYLSRTESHVDEEVWFTQEDVARGEDTVVKRAIEWIQNLAHAHDVAAKMIYADPDSAILTAYVENPNQHELLLIAEINNMDDVTIDSLNLFDDGIHGDGSSNDNIWGNFYLPTDEQLFKLSVTTNDISEETSRTLSNVARFTTIGPITLNRYQIISSDTIPNHGDQLGYRLTLRNEGQTATATDITTSLIALDPCVANIGGRGLWFGNISPGETVTQTGTHTISFSDTGNGCSNPMSVQVLVEISSGGFVLWYDTLEIIVTDIEESKLKLPKTFALQQNYPNPFNPSTTIEFSLPKSEFVKLKVYNLLGKEVSTFVSNKLSQGNHTYQFDGKNLSSGIYYYQLVAGDYREVKKMILLK